MVYALAADCPAILRQTKITASASSLITIYNHHTTRLVENGLTHWHVEHLLLCFCRHISCSADTCCLYNYPCSNKSLSVRKSNNPIVNTPSSSSLRWMSSPTMTIFRKWSLMDNKGRRSCCSFSGVGIWKAD